MSRWSAERTRALSLPGNGRCTPVGVRSVRAVLAAATGVYLVRAAAHIVRDLVRDRADRALLRSQWTFIPSQASPGRVAIHARVIDVAESTLLPVVVLHGYGMGANYLVPLAARLALDVRVLLPDLPGHGASGHEDRPLRIPELADALGAWMDATRVGPVLLITHSFGCQVGMELAVRRPELVGALILVGPTCDTAARSWVRLLARGIATAPFERPAFALWAGLDYIRAGLRVLVEEMRQMTTHRPEEVLPLVHAPALVLRGGRDFIAGRRWAATVARLLRAPAAVTLPRRGHAVQYADPAGVARVVLAFAREVNAESRLPARP